MIEKDYKEIGYFEEVDILGKKYLFTDLRVLAKSLPKGLYKYDIRHSDVDFGDPVSIERRVFVNYFGCIISDEELDFKGNDLIYLYDINDPDNEGFFHYTDRHSVKPDELIDYFKNKKE